MSDVPPEPVATQRPFDDAVSALTDRQFARVAAFIERTTGIRVPEHKRDLVRLRLVKRVRALELNDVDEYVRYALGGGEADGELCNLVDVVTTNKTSFFREEDHFDFLRERAIPALLDGDVRLGRDDPLVMWSAGCASGEEAYTIAMVLWEHERLYGPLLREIHATDICGEALRRGARAVYPDEAVETVPEELRRRYLLQSKDREARQVRIVAPLRRAIRFAHCNLVHDDPPFAARALAHVVFCRNVLIYFGRETQQHVLSNITRHIAPGGYLFVGHAEMLHGLDLPLRPVGPTTYRRL